MSKIYTPMSNVLTAEFPNNSLSAGAWLWSSSILLQLFVNFTWISSKYLKIQNITLTFCLCLCCPPCGRLISWLLKMLSAFYCCDISSVKCNEKMKWNVFGFTHFKLWLQSNEKWLQKNVIKITKYVHVLLYYFPKIAIFLLVLVLVHLEL